MAETTPTDSPGIGHNGPPGEIDDPAFWHELIPETEAADFLDVTPRSLQSWRQRGGVRRAPRGFSAVEHYPLCYPLGRKCPEAVESSHLSADTY